MLNLFIAITSLLFIVLPQILSEQQIDNSTTTQFDWKDIFTGDVSIMKVLL